ncbi:SMC family ATPase [Chryseobacterium sp. SN22]|uniref:AAA family ATPase n=1 Tax=Chryseobacterium sp. SN22 TaxID=2606431 RepID=UPI0011EE2859|nr:SMC family ATPase [Chryseobacterium sp. SN22]KAA0126730.1 SMC family ATPase [Chryseobacterium sp. SN22]
MIPVQLTLEGLYSYRERQKIDFENLTEAGLFGIFGAVGSGKSSILEAISFALYGETERLNSRDRRTYNMMNLKSNRSYIEFDFINFENKKFRATREFKRNSKNFEDVKTPSVTFYKWKNDNWIPLEHSNAEQLIGLSYANFKRTIIIPQGQFKEFLELGATERTNMMKEIFGLQRFDLQNNVSALHTKNRSELDHLEGRLKGFEEVSEDKIAFQKENLENEQKKFEQAQQAFKETGEKYARLKNLKADFELLHQKKSDFEKLTGQKEEIDALENRTEIFDRVSRNFMPLLNEKNKLEKEISEQKSLKEQQLKIWQETGIRYRQVQDKLSVLQPQYEVLPQSRIRENDLLLILQMLKFSEEIKMLKARTQKGDDEVQKVEARQKLIRQNIETLQKESEVLRSRKLDSNVLVLVGNWFLEKKKLEEALQKQIEKTEAKKAEIKRVSDELKSFNLNTETFKNDFQTEYEALENRKKSFSERRSQLEVQQKLAHFAGTLHDGESCPLCGALEHPHIVEFDDVNAELEEIQKKILDLATRQENRQRQLAEIEKILDRKSIFEEQLNLEEESVKQVRITIDQHLKSFIWKEFNAESQQAFEEKRQESFAIDKKMEELNVLIASQQKDLEKERTHLDQYNKALEKFRIDEAKKEEQILTNEANLKMLRWTDYREQEMAGVEEIHSQLSKSNLETEQLYLQFASEEKEISPALARQKTMADESEKRISALEQEISLNKNLIETALAEHQFEKIEEIQQILLQKINVPEARAVIQQFRIRFETLKNSILELEHKLKDFAFNEEEFSAAEDQFKTKEQELKTANDAVVKALTEIERLEKEFKKKEDLLKELAQLQKRADNLKIMTSLFKGAGFVQYVSSIYLRQLCDHANIRFHRMTRNQLSLQLNDSNDFEIVDYLNEGRSRSVKTLSGGQAFQVSLSLALALAESVQSNASAEKNFFFIDEGFGTQDSESVNIVFETLMNLRKENRIVGIISHVEELKEKIPVALNITKDEEHGSLIEIV